jgi:3-isopropylmalate dehydrogenase
VRLYPGLLDASPLRPERLQGVDLLIVRELTGGLYFGTPQGIYDEPGGRRAVDTMAYAESEIERVLRVGFTAARGRRKRLTSVDKANVLATSRLWRQTATRLAGEYPDVELEHLLVDSAAMRLVTAPASFDVVVTENTFGDILSDEASVLCGSLGLLPSASLGHGRKGLYEPVHGTAPDIAGRGAANPLGAILSAALLLRHSCDLKREATAVEDAVSAALTDGLRTPDLAAGGPSISTSAMGDAIVARLAAASRSSQ